MIESIVSMATRIRNTLFILTNKIITTMFGEGIRLVRSRIHILHRRRSRQAIFQLNSTTMNIVLVENSLDLVYNEVGLSDRFHSHMNRRNNLFMRKRKEQKYLFRSQLPDMEFMNRNHIFNTQNFLFNFGQIHCRRSLQMKRNREKCTDCIITFSTLFNKGTAEKLQNELVSVSIYRIITQMTSVQMGSA